MSDESKIIGGGGEPIIIDDSSNLQAEEFSTSNPGMTVARTQRALSGLDGGRFDQEPGYTITNASVTIGEDVVLINTAIKKCEIFASGLSGGDTPGGLVIVDTGQSVTLTCSDTLQQSVSADGTIFAYISGHLQKAGMIVLTDQTGATHGPYMRQAGGKFGVTLTIKNPSAADDSTARTKVSERHPTRG